MVVGVLYLEDVLELPWLVFYFGLVVYLNRSDVVQLDREAKRLQEADWGFGQYVVRLFDS